MTSSFLMRFLGHTQRRTTVGRTPLDEWSARRRDLYLTTHNTHNRQASTPPAEFEPTISAGERPQTYALDRAATGTGILRMIQVENYKKRYIKYIFDEILFTGYISFNPTIASQQQKMICHYKKCLFLGHGIWETWNLYLLDYYRETIPNISFQYLLTYLLHGAESFLRS